MEVIGYIRVSTEEQAKSGLGMEAQEKKIKMYCELYELNLVDIVTDKGFSGKNLKRPGIQEVFSSLKAGKAEGIVIAKLDRLTRSISDMGNMLETTLQENQLFSVAENIDTRSASGRLVLNVLTSVAQWERETIGERTKDALDAKKARGEKTGGYTPFGYTNINGKLEENQAEQNIIKNINALRAKGYSLQAIANELNTEGYKTKKGKCWNRMQIKRIMDKSA